VWTLVRLRTRKQNRNNAKDKNIFNSLAVVINKNKRNAVGNSEAPLLWIFFLSWVEYLIGRDGFRERGALGHLSFGGPKPMWLIWPFVWKAWKYAPFMSSAPSEIYFLLCRLWFYICLRSGVSKIQPAGQNRPVARLNPARGMIS